MTDDCREFFEVRITHRTTDQFEEYRNGKYQKSPSAINMIVIVKDPKDVYEDIINLMKSFRAINFTWPIPLPGFRRSIKELALKDDIDVTITFQNRVDKLQHKLESLKYHMKQCVEQEKNYEYKYKNNYVNSIVNIKAIDPIFVYETESYLFQTKASLDILAHLIAIAYRLSTDTYGDDGKDLADKLRKSAAHRQYQDQKDGMISIIENEDWVGRLVCMRNLITHYSDLLGSNPMIHRATSERDEYAIVCYPSMPDGERVTTFMNDTWNNLTRLIEKVGINLTILYKNILVDITSVPDTNMNTAYSWASQLADLSHLKITLGINESAILISQINELLGNSINNDCKSGGTGLFEYFSEIIKEIVLNRIDDILRHYNPLETNEKYQKSIGLRLWLGCLSAAKIIALETRDGPNKPEMRAERFQQLDTIANHDSIFRAGVESAPLFKKNNQQCYSFNGVPSTSPVRRYPNEYLIDG